MEQEIYLVQLLKFIGLHTYTEASANYVELLAIYSNLAAANAHALDVAKHHYSNLVSIGDGSLSVGEEPVQIEIEDVDDDCYSADVRTRLGKNGIMGCDHLVVRVKRQWMQSSYGDYGEMEVDDEEDEESEETDTDELRNQEDMDAIFGDEGDNEQGEQGEERLGRIEGGIDDLFPDHSDRDESPVTGVLVKEEDTSGDVRESIEMDHVKQKDESVIQITGKNEPRGLGEGSAREVVPGTTESYNDLDDFLGDNSDIFGEEDDLFGTMEDDLV